MLKIKDGVDMKELEKFGITPRYRLGNDKTGESYIVHYISDKYVFRFGALRFSQHKRKRKGLFINAAGREISDNTERNESYKFDDDTWVDVDLLYDLIQAGVIEKVEDEW